MGGRWSTDYRKATIGHLPLLTRGLFHNAGYPVLTVVAGILLATAFQVETLPALVALVNAV